MNFPDVHTFDGQWEKPTFPVVEQNERAQLFLWSLQMILDCPGLQFIISCVDKPENYDQFSKCTADEILVVLLQLARKREEYREEIFSLLKQQLNDMYKLGRCPQGRVNRLMQVWKAFESILQ